MVCPCDGNIEINTCAPYANRNDVVDVLTSLCADCYAEVDASVLEADFCSTAFNGAFSDCCDYAIVKRGTDEFFISTDCANWYKITKTQCYETVLANTLPEDFVCDGWGDISNLPDPNFCEILFMFEGCNIWMVQNDPGNCDLGECPAVGGTGTDWVKLSNDSTYPERYISGFDFKVSSNTDVTVKTGTCRDDLNLADMEITHGSTLTLDATTVGANGLDAGALAVSTWYYLWIISGVGGTALLASTTSTPTMPVNYIFKRRIGWIRASGGGVLRTGELLGNVWHYTNHQALLTDANITSSFVNYTISSNYIPPTSFNGNFYMSVNPAGQIGLEIRWRWATTDSIVVMVTPFKIATGLGTYPVNPDDQSFSIINVGTNNDENLTLHINGYTEDNQNFGYVP